jgi:peptidoglycan/xylan/chitin deacetylase (PgdA/CDA1 family)
LKQAGYQSIGWSLKSRDTVTQEPEAVVNRILEKVRPGDMILFHDNRKVTAPALALLIPALKERGFSFTRPDELLKLDVYEKE